MKKVFLLGLFLIFINSFVFSLSLKSSIIQDLFQIKITMDLSEWEINQIGIFLTYIGFVYAIIIGFSVSFVFSLYHNILKSFMQETTSLKHIYNLSFYFNNEKVRKIVREKIKKYVTSVIKNWNTEKGRKGSFKEVFELTKFFKVKTLKDAILLKSITEELTTASNAREDRIVLTEKYIPPLQWIIIIFLTFSLLLGFFLYFPSEKLISIVLINLLSITFSILIFIIYDLDHPFTGIWAHSPKYFESVLEELES